MTFERLCALIESNPELLFGATEAAASVIDRHLLDVGIDKPWFHLNRLVEIEPGPLVIQTPERASMTLDWHAPVDGRVLPRLQAELIVTAVITSAVSPITSIAIVGSFETPKSLLASLSDRLAVRQAVRAAAEQFVQSTATRLQAEAMSGI